MAWLLSNIPHNTLVITCRNMAGDSLKVWARENAERLGDEELHNRKWESAVRRGGKEMWWKTIRYWGRRRKKGRNESWSPIERNLNGISNGTHFPFSKFSHSSPSPAIWNFSSIFSPPAEFHFVVVEDLPGAIIRCGNSFVFVDSFYQRIFVRIKLLSQCGIICK